MRKNNKKLSIRGKKAKGFTLIELMVVLAVIAVIVSIAVPNFDAIRESVNVKVDKQSCETIKSITRTYLADGTLEKNINFTYTPNSGGGDISDVSTGSTSPGDDYKDALSEVKAPQTNKTAGYKVKINSGKVTVQVEGKPNTSTGESLGGETGSEGS